MFFIFSFMNYGNHAKLSKFSQLKKFEKKYTRTMTLLRITYEVLKNQD